MNHNIIAMRKLILFPLLFVCAGLFSAQKSVNNRHVSLKECNNDTLLYIKTNFLQNKQNYVGLPMDSLFNDLDIPIKSFGARYAYLGEDKDIIGMYIGYLKGAEMTKYEKQKKSYYEISIWFEEPYTKKMSVWKEFRKDRGVYWIEEYRAFFKDFIIKDLSVFDAGKRQAVK